MDGSTLVTHRGKQIEIDLPTLHVDQVKAYQVFRANRFTSLRCGRRWGKTDFDKTLAADTALKGWPVGWFAPDYKIQAEAWNELSDILDPVMRNSNKTEGVMRLITKPEGRPGGRIDFWTLENERAGRSRKYKLVIVDEAAFTKPNMADMWKKNIRPTLVDMRGKALASSNTNGNDNENWFWQICNESQLPEHDRAGWAPYHATTHANPYLPAEELAGLQRNNHPLVYAQEYLAEFVDWSGVAFFAKDKWLVNDQPVAFPAICDCVFAIIDSGTKTGKENDGTGVVYFARSKHVGHPLYVLDWDLQQIEGALLENWLPTVFARCQELAAMCRARFGSVGVLIEDKDSGQILLQQAAKRPNWPAHAINSVLTSMGKDQRAISVSGYHYRGEVKITQHAFDKITVYKGASRNHFMSQVVGFRVNDKDAAKREDDLLDGYCYGLACGLGNWGGF